MSSDKLLILTDTMGVGKPMGMVLLFHNPGEMPLAASVGVMFEDIPALYVGVSHIPSMFMLEKEITLFKSQTPDRLCSDDIHLEEYVQCLQKKAIIKISKMENHVKPCYFPYFKSWMQAEDIALIENGTESW